MASTRPAAEKLFEDVSVSIHLRSRETSFELKIVKSDPRIDRVDLEKVDI